ncbi:MAG: hypothetical protein IJQ81_15255 [Oscillibacter sp.]|nr:hypothetical protein [Oscillibacter sp.]
MNAWKQPLKSSLSALFLLGTCPVLAACDTCANASLIAAASVLVFALTNFILYLLRGVVTGGARIAVLLTTASAFAALAVLLTKAYFPSHYDDIALYLPLTALQCAALDRVFDGDDFRAALKTWARPAMLYVLTLFAVGLLREFLGVGAVFGLQVLPSDMEPVAFFHSVPGAFLTLGLLLMGAKAAGFLSDAPREEAQS